MAQILLELSNARVLAHDEVGNPTPNVGLKGDVMCELPDGTLLAIARDRFEALFPDAEIVGGVFVIPFEVESTVPADEATGVVVSANLTVTFSAPVDETTLNNTNLKVAPVSTHTAVAAVYTVDASGTVVTINPNSSLGAAAEHEIVVTAGVKDLAGNSAVGAPVTVLFTTA